MAVKRISLAEVSETTGTMLSAKAYMGEGTPTLRDLTECLYFSPGDGRIWLNDRRMVLMQTSALSMQRQELIATLGLERTRGLLTRTGYNAGASYAELVRKQWPGAEPMHIFLAGTRLHALEGMVKVETKHLEFNPIEGNYSGEFIWHNSAEAEEHIAAFGPSPEPVCWTQLGYAIGYVTTLLGKLVIFREVECRAAGDHVCRVVGKPAEEWPDVEEDLRYLNAEGFLSTSAYSIPQTRQTAKLPDLEETDLGIGETHMVGISAAFNVCCHQLKRVAPTQATVLFTGESGVGKELFAQMLHEISPRKGSPFISINCAAIPETLVESELFGVERGAYTGATASRPGRFERADGGTLFLDEIGTLSLVSQGKLLRALQQGVVERVGGTQEIRVNVRVVAATNVDLEEEVRRGRFREDLFFRLNVFPIRLPPLRDRREDIPLLLSYFLQRYNLRHGRRVTGFTTRAVRALLSYRYPGNIRELQNLVERGVISADDGEPIDLRHLFRYEEMPDDSHYSVGDAGALASDTEAEAVVGGSEAAGGLLDRFMALSEKESLSLEDLELRLVQEAADRCKGNLSAAARLLGLSRAQLAYRLSKTGQPNGATAVDDGGGAVGDNPRNRS